MVRRYGFQDVDDPYSFDNEDDSPFAPRPNLLTPASSNSPRRGPSNRPWSGGGKDLSGSWLDRLIETINSTQEGIVSGNGFDRRLNPGKSSTLPNSQGRRLTPMSRDPEQRGLARGTSGRKGRAGPGMPEPPGYGGGSFADYLAQAMAAIGGGGDDGTGAVDNRIAAAKSTTAEGNARIAAMYKALDESLKGSVPIMREQTDAAIDSNREQADLSQEGVEEARNAARDAEAANLDNIAIGDSELLRAGRDRADSDTQFSVGQIQDRAQTQGNYLNNTLDARLTGHQGTIDASGMRGVEQQVQNERTLANMLAELEDERYAAQQQAAQRDQQSRLQAIGLAQDMSNQDYGRWQDQQGLEMDLDDRAYGRAQDQFARNSQGGPDMELILSQLPEGSPLRSMIISQMMGMDPVAYEMLSRQPRTPMRGMPKGVKKKFLGVF